MAILRAPHRGVLAHRTGAVVVAATVLVSTLVAGCGSGDDGGSNAKDQQSETEAWAHDVCTSVGAWGKTVADARASLSNPRELSVADLEDVGNQVRTATRTMIADLEDAGIPQTVAGTQVRQQMSQLADQLKQQVKVVEDAQASSADTAGEVLHQVSVVAGALATVAADAKAALTGLRESMDEAAVGDAFAASPACQDLGVGG